MSNVNVAITTKRQTVAASPAASSNIRYQLMQDGVVKDTKIVGIASLITAFTGVVDGTYTVVAQRMSMANTPIGDAATSDPFTVVNTTEIDVPGSIGVTM